MMSMLNSTPAAWQINKKIILWTTLIGGFFSSLVKWGSEVNMPPRMPGEISPPGANIDAWLGWLGFNSHSLDYVYQGVTCPALLLYITGCLASYSLSFMLWALLIGRKSACGMALSTAC